MKKIGIGVRNAETNDKDGQDVKEDNTPKHLFDGAWDRLVWIGRFTSGNTDDFNAIKRKGSSQEYVEDANESVRKCTTCQVEVTHADIVTTSSASVDAQANNDKDNDD